MARASAASLLTVRPLRSGRLARAVLGGIATVALLTACGDGSTGTSPNSGLDGPGVVTETAGGERNQLGKILDCLDAAGIKLPSAPVDVSTAKPGGSSNGLQGLLEEPASKKALEACGLKPLTDSPAATPSS